MIQNPYKSAYLISIFTLAILTLLSLFWYKERMFFLDPCWVSFNIINTKTFSFAEYRYGAFISQLFPLTAVYLGFSLKSILILYSVGFYVFYLSSALIIGFIWKQKWLGILLALYFIVFVSDVYFWPNNEVHQGVTWMFLFLALYLKSKKEKKFTIFIHFFLIVLAALALCSHLIVLIVFLYLWLYIHLKKKDIEPQKKNVIFYTLLILSFGAFRYWLSSSGWYDAQKLEPIQSLSVNNIIHSFHSGQSKTFLMLVGKNYWIVILPFVLGVFALLKHKKFIHIFLLISFAFGYYSLICLTYPDAYSRSLRFYMESEWMALSIILLTPFVIEFHQTKKRKSVLTLVLGVIFLVRLIYIFDSYQFFHKRFENLKEVTFALQKKGISKALIFEDKEITDSLFIMSWGLPVESMMLSQIDNVAPHTSFKFVENDFKPAPMQDSFYSCFDIQPLSFLNPNYFQLDTKQKYQLLLGLNELKTSAKP